MSWRVCFDENADQTEVRKVMAKYGFWTMLQPCNVTRMEDRNGLLCHREPELCFVSLGPDEVPDGMLDEPLINAVTESPEATMC